MQTSTLHEVDARPVAAAPVSSARPRHGPAVGSPRPSFGQEMLAPFMAELSKVDARNKDARANAGDDDDAESAGLAGVSATLTENIQEGERSLRGTSRALRRQQDRDETRAHLRDQRDTQRRALEETTREPGVDGQDKSRSPRTALTRSEESAADQSPRTIRGRREGQTSSDPQTPARADAAEPPGRGSSSTTGTTEAAHTAARGRPHSASLTAPPPPNTKDALRPSAESVGKITASGRSSGAGSVRTVAPMAAAQAQTSAASAARGAESSALQSARLDSAAAKAAAPRNARAGHSLPAASSEESKNDANVKQMLRVIHGRIGQSHSHVTMRLEPAALGSIRISMDLNQGLMNLQITAESHLAQRLLSEKGQVLREALDASGITLDRFEVRAAAQVADEHDPGQPPQLGHYGAGDGSEQGGAERPADEREAESQTSHTATDDPGEGQMERTAESSLNVLA